MTLSNINVLNEVGSDASVAFHITAVKISQVIDTDITLGRASLTLVCSSLVRCGSITFLICFLLRMTNAGLNLSIKAFSCGDSTTDND